MDSSTPLQPPEWVKKRDGRLEPFDADKINRALFAVTESLGRPDPFVARELTDGVVHFLAREADQATISSLHIEELLIKVLRELGQAEIAQAFAEHGRRRAQGAVRPEPARAVPPRGITIPPGDVLDRILAGESVAGLERRCGRQVLEAFCLEHVFTRNLAAAHGEGLLILGGLEEPMQLSAAVARLPLPASLAAAQPHRGLGVFERVEQARSYVGELLVLDSPERELAQRGARVTEAAVFCREVSLAARTLNLRVILNLNAKQGPAEELAEGPLFAGQHGPDRFERVLGLLDAFVEQAQGQSRGYPVLTDWHVAEEDFEEELSRQRLLRLARAALAGAAVRFVFDRARRPVLLGEGLDRQRPAVIQWVGLNLVSLMQRQPHTELTAFLSKVRSLARLAVSAGVQKRAFLRDHATGDRPAFLIDRAHLGLYLIGLPDLLQQHFGSVPPAAAGGTLAPPLPEPATAFAQQLLRGLQEGLDREASSAHLRCVVDEPPHTGVESRAWTSSSSPLTQGGETKSRGGEDWKGLLRHAGRLHAALGRGTLRLALPEESPLSAAELVERLHFAWRQTALARLALVRPAKRQMSLVSDPEG